MANSKANQATDILNSIGTFILDIDYRYIGLVAILLVVAVLVIKRSKGSTADYLSVGLAFLLIYTASIIGSVFLLTKPPAISKLGDSELVMVGFLSFIMLAGLGIQQIFTTFSSRTSTKVIRVPIDKVKDVQKLIGGCK